MNRKGLIIMMTTNELAVELDTTPRTLRKFLRFEGKGVGKGSRYALPSTKREVKAISKRFAEWDEARNATTSADETPEVEVDAPEVSLDELTHPDDA